MSLKESLISLGLTEKEARVYVALVSLGESVVYVIAERAGLKRPTAYVTLNELVKKGYAKRIPRARKQLYFPVPPDEVFTMARERLRGAEEALPELRALSKANTKQKVRTTYFEGAEQTKNAYFDALNYPNAHICEWLSNTPFKEHGKEYWYSTFRPRRLAQNITTHIIVPDTPDMRHYAADDAEAMKETKIDESDEYAVGADIMLYGENRVCNTSFKEMTGLIIESKHIHDTLLAIFRRHWALLEKKTS